MTLVVALFAAGLVATFGGIAWMARGYGKLKGKVAELEGRLDAIDREGRRNDTLAAVPVAPGSSSPPSADEEPGAAPLSPPGGEAVVSAEQSLPAPSAAPPRVGSAQAVEALRGDVAAMIASPAMRRSDYDAVLRRYGEMCAIDVAPDGAATLSRWDDDPKRRLVAVVFDDENVAVVPSSRYVKDFAMTFKETIEAGQDVRLLFTCTVDGTAKFKVAQLATGVVNQTGGLDQVVRGRLAGFIR